MRVIRGYDGGTTLTVGRADFVRLDEIVVDERLQDLLDGLRN
jgi:hypothetical protein